MNAVWISRRLPSGKTRVGVLWRDDRPAQPGYSGLQPLLLAACPYADAG
jgi:hypothetical protein